MGDVTPADGLCDCIDCSRARAIRERDEALAEVERLRGVEARLEEADVELTMQRGEVERLREGLLSDENVARTYARLYGQSERMDDDLREHIVNTLTAALGG